MPPDPHGPPADLDTTSKALYRKLRDFLKASDSWEDSDKYVLGATCRHEMLMRVALAGLPKDKRGVPILTDVGYKGQPTQHPNYKTFQAEAKAFVEGLKELGLTPRARAQLGIESKPQGGGKFGL